MIRTMELWRENMAQYVHKKFPTKEQDEHLEKFCVSLQKLKTVREIKYFLKDLLNRGERLMIVRRFMIAQMLESGKTYEDIIAALGVGRGTIARVEKLVNFGRGGIKNAIKKSEKLKK